MPTSAKVLAVMALVSMLATAILAAWIFPVSIALGATALAFGVVAIVLTRKQTTSVTQSQMPNQQMSITIRQPSSVIARADEPQSRAIDLHQNDNIPQPSTVITSTDDQLARGVILPNVDVAEADQPNQRPQPIVLPSIDDQPQSVPSTPITPIKLDNLRDESRSSSTLSDIELSGPSQKPPKPQCIPNLNLVQIMRPPPVVPSSSMHVGTSADAVWLSTLLETNTAATTRQRHDSDVEFADFVMVPSSVETGFGQRILNLTALVSQTIVGRGKEVAGAVYEVGKKFVCDGEDPWLQECFKVALSDSATTRVATGIAVAGSSPRSDYQRYIDNLRARLVGPSRSFCLDEAHKQIAQRQMHLFFRDLVRKLIQAGKAQCTIKTKGRPLLERQFVWMDHVPARFKRSALSVALGKLEGATGRLFDPHREGNFPFQLYTIPQIAWQRMGLSKSVQVIRMATPTQEDIFGNCTIIPEMIGHLDYLASRQQIHFYISLQSMNSSVEGNRNKVLIELARKYPMNFKIMVLDQDSSFYLQKDGDDLQVAQTFLKQFEEHLAGGEYHFPFDFLPEFHSSWLSSIHQTLFSAQEKLTRNERQIFIEIYYLYLIKELLLRTGCDFMNITCKDAIDRAGKTNALFFQFISIMTGSWDMSAKDAFYTFVHAPAFLAKQQAMIVGRRERLCMTHDYLETHKVEVRNLDSSSEQQHMQIPR